MQSLLQLTFVCLTLFLQDAFAAPAPATLNARDGTPTIMSTTQVETYLPYAYLSGAGYCSFQSQWNCGIFCDNVPDFELYTSGGDGSTNPHWYVGYAPSLSSIVVGHQGTNLSDVVSLLNDLNIIQSPLPQQFFPGAPSGAGVHTGFLGAMTKSASQVFAAVKDLVASKGSSSVTIVGHSLGAATANLSGVSLKLLIPSINVKVVSLAAPRVGNSAFTTLTDTTVAELHYISNKKDPVPTLPPRLLGYAHPNGEIHIDEDDTWYACPGHDNTAAHCTIATVPNLLVADFNDHGGPYLGVSMGGDKCTK